jgi:two-component system sensor histidine kinase SenX3
VADAEADRISTARLHQALAAVPLGVAVSDAGGEIVFLNEPATQLVTLSPSGVLAEAAFRRLLARALGGTEEADTLELYGPPRRSLSITARPLASPEGEALGAVAVIDDLSERRRLDAIRRDFVANISHELKTPVAAVALLAETLAGEDEPDVVRRLAGRIQVEAQRVARIMDDLLDLSRIESEDVHGTEAVAVRLVMLEAAERVRAAAEQRGIHVRVDDVDADATTLVGDRRDLVSATYNLLENAVKYSDPGSTVELEAARHEGYVDVVVRDHGIGIAGSEIDRIFERFYRVDRARARDTGGTGLGLSIVRHIVANHGGDVLVESREGVGSTFTMRFPLTVATREEQ